MFRWLPGSSSAFHVEIQRAVFWGTQIVVEPRHFEGAQWQNATRDLMPRLLEQSLQLCDADALYAFDRLPRGHQLADINAAAERETVRMKKAEPPIGANAPAKDIAQRCFNV